MSVAESYYALTVAIMTNCLPERAFAKLEGGQLSRHSCRTVEEVDLQVIPRLKQKGWTYKQLQETFCISQRTAFTICHRENATQAT